MLGLALVLSYPSHTYLFHGGQELGDWIKKNSCNFSGFNNRQLFTHQKLYPPIAHPPNSSGGTFLGQRFGEIYFLSKCLSSFFQKRAQGTLNTSAPAKSIWFKIANIVHSYALFKAKDKKLLDDDDLTSRLKSADKINSEYVALLRTNK